MLCSKHKSATPPGKAPYAYIIYPIWGCLLVYVAVFNTCYLTLYFVLIVGVSTHFSFPFDSISPYGPVSTFYVVISPHVIVV